MITDHLSWGERLMEWIPGLVEQGVPFMGICFGHQLLAQSMGGEVGYHFKGKEIGTVAINLLPESTGDPLFGVMPEKFHAHVTHSQSILSLPREAVTLARNDFESNHAFRIGNCAWGVQFHPEYDVDIMKAYINNQASELEESGHNISDLLATVKETSDAANIMKRFANYIM
jgi:GMP synthase (glutamine-hydrolysing)